MRGGGLHLLAASVSFTFPRRRRFFHSPATPPFLSRPGRWVRGTQYAPLGLKTLISLHKGPSGVRTCCVPVRTRSGRGRANSAPAVPAAAAQGRDAPKPWA